MKIKQNIAPNTDIIAKSQNTPHGLKALSIKKFVVKESTKTVPHRVNIHKPRAVSTTTSLTYSHITGPFVI